MSKPRFLTLVGMIALAALSRLVPHPWNATPVAAMALFSGAYFSNRWQAVLIPLCALFISDLFLGFHSLVPVVYACFVITVFLGRRMIDQKTAAHVILASVTGSILFFLVTNFFCWITMAEYSKDAAGLMTCFTAAIPFFRNTLAGDLFFSAALFGSFALCERAFPQLRETTA